MEDELTVIEVALTYIGAVPVMLIKTPANTDYDSGMKASEWVNRVKSGKRSSVIALHPVDGLNGTQEDVRRPTCPVPGCQFDDGHEQTHQDVKGNAINPADPGGGKPLGVNAR